MTCGYCRKDFKRDEILPPRGAVRPPGCLWRCRSCHADILKGQIRRAMVRSLKREYVDETLPRKV